MKKELRKGVLAFAIIWIGAIAAGLIAINNYSQADGPVGEISRQWPTEAGPIPKPASKSLLVVFFHPECSCSDATVAELNELLAKVPRDRVETVAAFVKPSGWTDAQLKGSLWKDASAIPGVRVLEASDRDAEIFGARTSGHAFLYDRRGSLRFSGGLTPSRGHMGDAEGPSAIIKALRVGGSGDPLFTRIFGCGLFDGPFSKVAALFRRGAGQ